MANDILAKFILVVLSISGITWALVELFQFNWIIQFLPQYSRWIYIGFGIIGGWTLYNALRR